MKTKHFSGIRYVYAVTTKWISIEKLLRFKESVQLFIEKIQKTEPKQMTQTVIMVRDTAPSKVVLA